jgi:hypothetical protein
MRWFCFFAIGLTLSCFDQKEGKAKKPSQANTAIQSENIQTSNTRDAVKKSGLRDGLYITEQVLPCTSIQTFRGFVLEDPIYYTVEIAANAETCKNGITKESDILVYDISEEVTDRSIMEWLESKSDGIKIQPDGSYISFHMDPRTREVTEAVNSVLAFKLNPSKKFHLKLQSIKVQKTTGPSYNLEMDANISGSDTLPLGIEISCIKDPESQALLDILKPTVIKKGANSLPIMLVSASGETIKTPATCLMQGGILTDDEGRIIQFDSVRFQVE